MQLDAGGSREVDRVSCRLRPRRSADTARGLVPDASRKRQPPPRDPDRARRSRSSTAAAIAAKRCVGDTRRRVRATSSATATSSCARSCATAAPATRDWQRGPDAPHRRAPRRRPLGRALHASTEPGRWTFTIEAWTDAFATWRDELERKVAAGQDDLPASCRRASLLLEHAADSAEGAGPRDDRARAARPARRRRAEHAKHDAALGAELLAAVERRQPPRADDAAEPLDARRRPRARAVRRLVRAVPALLGRLRRRRASSSRGSPSSASTSSTCRRSTRSA